LTFSAILNPCQRQPFLSYTFRPREPLLLLQSHRRTHRKLFLPRSHQSSRTLLRPTVLSCKAAQLMNQVGQSSTFEEPVLLHAWFSPQETVQFPLQTALLRSYHTLLSHRRQALHLRPLVTSMSSQTSKLATTHVATLASRRCRSMILLSVRRSVRRLLAVRALTSISREIRRGIPMLLPAVTHLA
jgi:hypothetical protein